MSLWGRKIVVRRQVENEERTRNEVSMCAWELIIRRIVALQAGVLALALTLPHATSPPDIPLDAELESCQNAEKITHFGIYFIFSR